MTKHKSTSAVAEEPQSAIVDEDEPQAVLGAGDGATESAPPGGSGAQAQELPERESERSADVEPHEELAPVEQDAAALASELKSAQKLAEEHWDTVLRTRAELDNMRKRSQREVENAHKYGLERVMDELLPVLDSLELGLSAARDENVEVAKVREGIELTLKMLFSATGKFGLKEVDPLGEAFDPEYHQAITVQEAAGRDPGTVTTVVQKGYLLNDRLIRPAMVIVAQ